MGEQQGEIRSQQGATRSQQGEIRSQHGIRSYLSSLLEVPKARVSTAVNLAKYVARKKVRKYIHDPKDLFPEAGKRFDANSFRRCDESRSGDTEYEFKPSVEEEGWDAEGQEDQEHSFGYARRTMTRGQSRCQSLSRSVRGRADRLEEENGTLFPLAGESEVTRPLSTVRPPTLVRSRDRSAATIKTVDNNERAAQFCPRATPVTLTSWVPSCVGPRMTRALQSIADMAALTRLRKISDRGEKMLLPGSCRGPDTRSKSRTHTLAPPEDDCPDCSGTLEFGELRGRGGSAEVYTVRNQDGYRFAMKIVKAKSARHWNAVLEEVNLLERLQRVGGKNSCKHVVRMHRSLEVTGALKLYLLLEHADCDLAEYIQKKNENGGRGMPFLELHECFLQMLKAVAHIHRHKIVHSDVKPANFLLVNRRIKLADFGLARRIQDDETHFSRHGQCGTIRFMAPEQIFQPANLMGGGTTCGRYETPTRLGQPAAGGGSFGGGGTRTPPGNTASGEKMANNNREKNRQEDAHHQAFAAPFHLKPSVDVWSLGMILFSLLYLQTPFQQLERKLRGCSLRIMFAISDPRVQIRYPGLDVVASKRGRTLQICEKNPIMRGTTTVDDAPAAGAGGSTSNGNGGGRAMEAGIDVRDTLLLEEKKCPGGLVQTKNVAGKTTSKRTGARTGVSFSSNTPTQMKALEEDAETASTTADEGSPPTSAALAPPEEVFRRMVAVLQKCLRRDPEERWSCDRLVQVWTRRMFFPLPEPDEDDELQGHRPFISSTSGRTRASWVPDPEPAGDRFLQLVVNTKTEVKKAGSSSTSAEVSHNDVDGCIQLSDAALAGLTVGGELDDCAGAGYPIIKAPAPAPAAGAAAGPRRRGDDANGNGNANGRSGAGAARASVGAPGAYKRLCQAGVGEKPVVKEHRQEHQHEALLEGLEDNDVCLQSSEKEAVLCSGRNSTDEEEEEELRVVVDDKDVDTEMSQVATQRASQTEMVTRNMMSLPALGSLPATIFGRHELTSNSHNGGWKMKWICHDWGVGLEVMSYGRKRIALAMLALDEK